MQWHDGAMSDSSPADLAISFRSLPRRLREARGHLAAAEIQDRLDAIDRHLARAASLVRSAGQSLEVADPVDPVEVADAIENTPADSWGDELDELRGVALALGTLIRAVAAANPDIDD